MPIKPLESIVCPICEIDNSSLLFESPGMRCYHDHRFTMVRCNQCGLIYNNPRLAKEDLSLCYDETYYAVREANRLATWLSATLLNAKVTELTRAFQNPGSTVLDMGYGSGEFLFRMQQRGWKTVGIDSSAAACHLATQRLGQNVFNASLEECQFPDSHFDLVTLWHVFEHVYDPLAELARIRRVLKDTGTLVLVVPNSDCSEFRLFKENCFHLESPVHVFHYAPATLCAILEKMKFRVTRKNLFALDFPLGMVHSAQSALMSSHRFKQNWKLMLALATPILLGATVINRLNPFTHDSPVMEVWAQKQENPR
ncbi:MAG: class I SAM-dependent methyltransferase [Chloroflexi bacterium]|nr:class I SAM-dependent methyltransferase [Chloroflexota bacterium]